MREVLSGASLTLQHGRRLGLIGANGSGKSTLLKILAGLDTPDSGGVTLSRGMRVGYLEQQGALPEGATVWQALEHVFDFLHEIEAKLRRLEAEMTERHGDQEAFDRLAQQYASLTDAFEDADGYAWQSAIQGVLKGLGFTQPQWGQPAASLSGGERTRLCLARVLLQKPDLLLLDEPTNHLDLAALAWLEQYLQSYKGAVVLVSHDRYLLDAVCTDIAELLFGKIEQYEGSYTRYQALRLERFESRQREYDAQQKEIARQKQIIATLRMFNREKSVKRAESREKILAKMERVEKPKDEKQIRFEFIARRRSGDDVLMIEDLAKGYEGRTLFERLNLHLRAGDRVALIGPNGIGKSTLLKIIARDETPDAGAIRYGANVDIGYYDQHQQRLHEEKTVLDELWDDFPQMEQARLRGVLGCFLFTGDDVLQPIHTLSGGERGRVALTRLMLRQDNLLLLDEPTNHLDMDSREVLEQALEGFAGTLLMVSHDRYFINRLASHILEMGTDGISLTLGNYDDYLAGKNTEFSGEPEEQKTRTALEKEKKRDRQTREAEKAKGAKLQALEAAIAAKEAELAAREAAMARPEVYASPERAKEAARAHRALKAELGGLYEAWTEMEE